MSYWFVTICLSANIVKPIACCGASGRPSEESKVQPSGYQTVDELLTTLQQAQGGETVVAALFTSEHCPFCIALKQEQLSPRMRANVSPKLMVVEFETARRAPFTLPNGGRVTVKDWGQRYGLKLTPTVVMLDRLARPIGEPLVGYASRDFYANYLEERIQSAQNFWRQH